MEHPHRVIERVQQKDYPPDWSVFQSKGGMKFAIGISVTLLCTGIIATLSFLPLIRLSIIAMCIGLLLPTGCVAWSTWLISSSLLQRRSLLVILPEGVVECYEGKIANTTTLEFEKIQHIDRETHNSTINNGRVISYITSSWLNIYGYHGEYTKWDIDSDYGDPIDIEGKIVAAYQYYRQQQQYMQHPIIYKQVPE